MEWAIGDVQQFYLGFRNIGGNLTGVAEEWVRFFEINDET